MPTIITQTTSSGRIGHTRRRNRPSSQAAYDLPSRRAARQLMPLAYPPTMKKIGMTCTIHVSHAVQGATVRMWEVVNVRVASKYGAAASQCPTVTTSIDIARRKSTYRFRDEGVRSASSAARDQLVMIVLPRVVKFPAAFAAARSGTTTALE